MIAATQKRPAVIGRTGAPVHKLARLKNGKFLLMPLHSGRTAPRLFCVLALLAAGSGTALAQATVKRPDDAAIQLDQSVQALKDELVQFNRDAQLAEDEFLYPPVSRVTVYVSNDYPGLLLDELRVVIDKNPPVTHRYDEYDSRALLADGALQRIFHGSANRGPHRITASFSGKLADGEAPVTGTYEGVFDKTVDPAEIELRIRRGGKRGGAAFIELREWRASE
jgi:hypothetical protein